MSSPVDMEMKSVDARNSFLDEVAEVAKNDPAAGPVETKPAEPTKPVETAPPEKPAETVKPEEKVVESTDPLDRLAKKVKKIEEKPADPAKVEKAPEGTEAEKKAAEEKKQYKWGELRKAAEEDLPAAIAERDKAIAEHQKLAKENAELKSVASERDELKKQSEELRTRLYVHDVRELPQYQENRGVIDSSMAAMKKAAEIHKFPMSALQDALDLPDETERSVKVDEVFDSAANPIGSTTRARLAGMVEDVSARKTYEAYLETNQKAALEAHKMHKEKMTQAEKSKANESYNLAAGEAFEKLKARVPLLADEKVASRVRSVPRISEQAPALQAAAAYALELLPDLLDHHDEEIAGHKAHSAEKDEKIKELEGIVAKYSGAGAKVTPGGDVKVDEKPMDFLEELEMQQKRGAPLV